VTSTPIRLSVDGLFGEFDHEVTFPIENEFAIIYGPNGIGKTKFFEVIVALSGINILRLARLPFSMARIDYADGTFISMSKRDRFLIFLLRPSSGQGITWECDPDEFQKTVTAGGSEWHQTQPGIWVDQADGETIDEDEFIIRYGPSPTAASVPDAFKTFQSSTETYLIETQRLLGDRGPSRRTVRNTALYRARLRRGGNSTAAVSRYANDIVGRLREALTTNSRNSAALDRTFPQRLLDATGISDVSEAEIRARYDTQNRKRERLARFSLIASEAEFPLPARDLADWERGVLWMYLQDTEEKLSTFDPILERVELLEEIVNKRFLRKRVRVDAEEGLVITTMGGADIAPEDLSSGEQHELIMFYDLLFSVSAGALVLIDEPEISLHVAWQRGFLDDMLRVAQLSAVRILVATHSPQIIGKWHSRTTQLGPAFHEDSEGWELN